MAMECHAKSYADKGEILMTTVPFMPFQNESDTFNIDKLTVENRMDRISIYGSLDITKNKTGLEHAMLLKRLIDGAIDELKRDKQLPDHISLKEADIVKNPFL